MAHATTPPTFTRRSLLKKSAIGAGLTVLAGTPVSLRNAGAGQIEVEPPPPATPGATTPAEITPLGPTIASKAAELEFDVEKIFRFVADEVRYEPYAGALRGANGTLWSLAGNSVDKALLFGALLTEALVKWRFAFGPLDAARSASLAAANVPDVNSLVTTYLRSTNSGFAARSKGVLGEPVATPAPAPGSAELAAIDELVATASRSFELATEMVDRQVAIIHDALSRANSEISPFAAPTVPDLEIERHCWIQVADGSDWIDYAPAFSDATAGLVPAPTVLETRSDIPADLIHTVTLRLVAEEFIGGSNVRRDAIISQLASANLVGVPISISVMPPAAFDNLGLTINQRFTGDATFVPVIVAGSTAITADTPIVFGVAGGGVFDVLGGTPEAGGLAEGETLGLWLQVDVMSPGAVPVSIERAILDRIGVAARQEPAIDFGAIEPVEIVTDPDGQQVVRSLAKASVLSVTVAQLPAAYAFNDTESLEVYGELPLAAAGVSAFRHGLRIDAELSRGIHSWISEPQLILTTVQLTEPESAESGAVISIDLLHHPATVTTIDATPSSSADIHPAILDGILNQVAEESLLNASSAGVAPGQHISVDPGVSTLLIRAADEGTDIVAITSSEQLGDLQLEADAVARLRAALEQGMVAIVPEQSIAIDGVPRSGWWLIDPVTGITRDERDNGSGFAAFSIPPGGQVRFGPIEEYTLLDLMIDVALWYYKYKRPINCIIGGAVLALGVAGALYHGSKLGAGQGDLGNVIGALGGGAGAASGAKSLLVDCFLGA